MLRLALLLCSLLGLSACHSEPDTLRLGSNRWLGYAPFYLADSHEQLKPAGIELIEYPNATGVMRGFRNGLLDAALLTLDEALILQSHGHDLEILLVTDLSAGADALFAKADIQQLEDLRGKRIGVENTALGAFFLARILDHGNLSASDVEVINLGVHEHVAAVRDGQVDAVVSFADAGPALQRLGAHRLFDSRQLPGEIIDVLAIERSRVSPEQRQQLRSSWYTALGEWHKQRKRFDPLIEQRLGLTPEELAVTLEGLIMGDNALNQRLREEGELLASIERLNSYLLKQGLIERNDKPANLLGNCGSPAC